MKNILFLLILLPFISKSQQTLWGNARYNINGHWFYWVNGTDTIAKIKGDSVVFYKPTNLTTTPDGNGIYGGSGSLTGNTTVTLGSNNLIFNATSTGKFRLNVGSDASGDTYYRDASGNQARVGIGAAGAIHVSDGTKPIWQTILFNNGVNFDGTNVTWGGAITGTKNITGAGTSDKVVFSGSSADLTPWIEIINTGTSGTPYALRLQATGVGSTGNGLVSTGNNAGVVASGTVFGLDGRSTSGIPVSAGKYNDNGANPAILAERFGTSGNGSILKAFTIRRSGFGGAMPQTNWGSYLTFESSVNVTGGGAAVREFNNIVSKITNTGGAAAASELSFTNVSDSVSYTGLKVFGKGNVAVNGGHYAKSVTVTSNTTLIGNECLVIIDASAGDVTVTLPAATASYISADGTGLVLNFARSDNTVNNVIVQAAGSDKINTPATNFTLTTQWQVIGVQAVSTSNWIKL